MTTRKPKPNEKPNRREPKPRGPEPLRLKLEGPFADRIKDSFKAKPKRPKP